MGPVGDIPERQVSKPSNNRGAAAVGGLRGWRDYRMTARRASCQSEALSAEPRLRPQGSAYSGTDATRVPASHAGSTRNLDDAFSGNHGRSSEAAVREE